MTTMPEWPKIWKQQCCLLCILALGGCGSESPTASEAEERSEAKAHEAQTLRTPNVLMIIVDDLNDWVGPTGGHPDVITPNFDRLAKQGITFTNAHNQAPVCMASRNSFFSGKQPWNLGSYNLQPFYRDLTAVEEGASMPEHFKANGYYTHATGKFFHGPAKGNPFTGLPLPAPALPEGDTKRATPPHPLNWDKAIWDWGPVEASDTDMPDYRRALEIAAYLRQPIDKPFFLGTNLYQPHVPMHVPQKYFAMYDRELIHIPEGAEEDLADLGPTGRAMALAGSFSDPSHADLLADSPSHPRDLVHAYLANVTFMDACLGVILDALEESPHANNTIIVVFGDNGWHVGEKQHWGKRTLWHESTRIPLILAGPGIPADTSSDQPAGLIDLYPTLLDLTGLPSRQGLEGTSLLPQIKKPDFPRSVPVLTTWQPGNHSVRTHQWVLIEYADGEMELYNRLQDPEEKFNLIGSASLAPIIEELRRWVPRSHVPHIRSPDQGTHFDYD